MLSKSNMYEQFMTGVLGDGDFSTIIRIPFIVREEEKGKSTVQQEKGGVQN